MKRNSLLIFALSFTGISYIQAQYTDIHDFNGTQGSTPEGSVTIAANKLYGMAHLGGTNNDGCIFSMDTTGTNYKDILDFTGANGKSPYYGELVYANGILYGMTGAGGANIDGCIFSIDTDGTSYKDLHDFTSADGKEPQGSLTLIGKTLFGMTNLGGTNTDGCIFSIDTNGSGYRDLFDFGGTNGSNPEGDLTPSVSGKVLYGTASLGGVNGDGCIFSIDTNGNSYKDLFDFNDQSNPQGANPPGVLLLVGDRLFGMATNGGLQDYGLIFSIDTNGNNYKDMFEFSNANGELPQGSLSLIGTELYGMATYGAVTNKGCMFSIDTSGSNYKVLLNFSNTNCFYPFGSLTFSGNMAYGTATRGGADSNGVVFSIRYKILGVANQLRAISDEITVYPNPSSGQFTIQSSSRWLSGVSGYPYSYWESVEVYNVLGEKVSSQFLIPNSQLLIDLSSQPNGVYIYHVLQKDGSLIGQGKVIIQK